MINLYNTLINKDREQARPAEIDKTQSNQYQ